VLLKYHYSIATPADLEWMFRPLSDLLTLLTGHEFQRDANAEWFSVSADARLVKGCAGINFMLMSLLTYAWVFRPDHDEESGFLTWLSGQVLLLAAVIVAAWATTLLANTVRIAVAIKLQCHDDVLEGLGLNGGDVHRLIGVMIYLPLLMLQMLPGKRVSHRQILMLPVLMYLLLMVVVPLLTGNALRNPGLFVDHLWQLSAGMAVMYGMYFLYRYCRRIYSVRRMPFAVANVIHIVR
jgi:exosortase K